MIKQIAAIIIVLTHLTVFAQTETEEAEDPCDQKEEQAVLKASMDCERKSNKSLKAWKTLKEAETAIETAIKNKDSKDLEAYVGCDALDTGITEVHCSIDYAPLVRKNIELIGNRSRGAKTLEGSKWVSNALTQDVLTLCSASYNNRIFKNHCDKSEKLQPIVDIKKSKAGYYIFGLPL